jgi:RNA polymerase sigma-70 factor (ECF subfamily)
VTELSDAEIIRRVLDGDSDAFRFLVARYRIRFGRFAVHMLGDRDDAEEVLQDAFFRAYRSLARCRDPEHFEAWLFRIVANRCRTAGGRRQRRELVLVRDTVALEAAPLELPDDPGDRAEAAAIVVARLDPATREAFLLKYVEELSFSEMARLTGVGVSALKMRVRRAAERLRRELEEEGYG